MIVAADFYGFSNGHQLTWSLDNAGTVATFDVRWNPRRPECRSVRITFSLPTVGIPDSFALLKPLYQSRLDGAGARSLSVILNGQTLRCTVHGTPSVDDHPEIEAFYLVWRKLSQHVDTMIESGRVF